MVRTRFSPSPTGLIHIGNARAALFSALYAAKENGAFLLRIEDTDLARSEQKYTEMLQEDLHWLGINWQEGPGVGGPHQPYWQSQRRAIYDNYFQELENKKLAYACFCTEQELALNRKLQLSRGQPPRYPGTCRKLSAEEVARRIASGLKPALRFHVPEKTAVDFTDLVKGLQHFNSDDIGDFIIRRADGSASFMFCNAIDDSAMKISHVLRGDDHLANTPRQLMILKALDLPAPQYGHLSMITGDDGAPLSKRHGSSSLNDLHTQGYLPIAVLNYLSRLSHTYEQQELISFQELATHFKIKKLSRAPARFDKNQLLHWQKEAAMRLDNAETLAWLDIETVEKIPEIKRDLFAEVMRKNILFPNEAHLWAEIFFGEQLQFTHEQIDLLKEATEVFFVEAEIAVKKHGVDIKSICDELKAKLNISGKKLFMPLRIALTGEQNGPELVHIATLLGQEKMLQHFNHALELVRERDVASL
ncbi:MAG: glutamate--tRNA ligase [Gammaproteobacteria bacterium]